MQHLERDLPVEFAVERSQHCPHAAPAQRAEQDVAPESLRGCVLPEQRPKDPEALRSSGCASPRLGDVPRVHGRVLGHVGLFVVEGHRVSDGIERYRFVGWVAHVGHSTMVSLA